MSILPAYELIRVYGPPTSISYTQKLTNIIDKILKKENCPDLITELKDYFGLAVCHPCLGR